MVAVFFFLPFFVLFRRYLFDSNTSVLVTLLPSIDVVEQVSQQINQIILTTIKCLIRL